MSDGIGSAKFGAALYRILAGDKDHLSKLRENNPEAYELLRQQHAEELSEIATHQYLTLELGEGYSIN